MNFKQGKDLAAGERVRLVAGVNGVANVEESTRTLLVTDQKDRKGNPLLVNTATGAGAYASSTSVWSVQL